MSLQGPQEQRLRTMLEAKGDVVRRAQRGWSKAETALRVLDRYLARARTQIEDEGKLEGKAGDRAVSALDTFDADLERHYENLEKGARALAATAAAIDTAQAELLEAPAPGPRPEPLKKDPAWSEDDERSAQVDHNRAEQAWSAGYEAREARCKSAADRLDLALEDATGKMKEIHGEPDGSGPGSSPPSVAPVSHTIAGAPPATHTTYTPPGQHQPHPHPSHQSPDFVFTESGPEVEPVGSPLIGAGPGEHEGADSGPEIGYEAPDHGDPGDHVTGEGDSGGPGLGTIGLAGAGLAGGAGIAKGISRMVGGSPLNRAARLGPGAVKGTSGAGAVAGRGGRKGKGSDGQGDGDVFDTEQDWYDDESQPGVLD